MNGKIYIGQTINSLEYRKKQHFRDCKRKRSKTYFSNALIKYGIDKFVFEVIENCNSIDELNSREVFWISYFDSMNKSKGYNLDSGGKNGKKSLSTKTKIGEKTKQRWQDEELSEKMLVGLRRGTDTVIKNSKTFYVEWKCPKCGIVLNLKPWQTKNKKFCSVACIDMGSITSIACQRASEVNRQNNIKRKKKIAEHILRWAMDNKNIIMNCPKNKITTNLSPLLESVKEIYGITDLRSLFVCFGVNGRKEFLEYLRKYIVEENVC